MKKFALPAGLVVIIAALIGVFILGGGSTKETSPKPPIPTKASADGLPGLLTTAGPWDANTSKLKERLDAIGLPALSQEALAFHIHQHLEMYIHGHPVAVPANVGINSQAGFISIFHTHETSGVLHVESPEQTDFTLGQFYDEWGVRFSQTCLGGNCADASNKLIVFANGKPVTGDPRQYKLKAHDEIVVAFGADAELPNPISATYAFSKGE